MARSSVREKRKRTLRFQWERLHRARRNDALRRIRKRFARVVDTVVHRYESRGILAAEPFDLLHRGELRDYCESTMSGQWRAMLSSGIQFESDWIKEAQPTKSQQRVLQTLELFPGGFQRQATGFELEEVPPSIYVDLTPEMKSAVDNWIARRRVGFWTKLEGVFLTKIAKTIADGIKEGDTLPNLRKRLQSELNGLSNYAANRIARTETTGAMNYGGQLERADLDIEYKEWVATIDIRTRTLENSGFDHLNANGDVAKNGDFFIVSGEKLLYPGDGDHGASAGNVIHCRCAAVASIDYNANKRPAATHPAETPKPVAIEPPKPIDFGALPEFYAEVEHELLSDATKIRVEFYRTRSRELLDETEKVRKSIVSKQNRRVKTLKKKLTELEAERDRLWNEAEEIYNRIALTGDPEPQRHPESKANFEKIKATGRKIDKQEQKIESAKSKAWGDVVKSLTVDESDRTYFTFSPNNGDYKTPVAKQVDEAGKTLGKIVNKKTIKERYGVIYNLEEFDDARASYDPNNATLNLSKKGNLSTVFHEMTHGIEWQSTDAARNASRGFLFDRAGENAKLTRLKEFLPDYNYKDDEVSFGPLFNAVNENRSHYAAKYYRHVGNSEVLTIGIEELYNDAAGFAERDPEYFRFVVGWLKGGYAEP